MAYTLSNECAKNCCKRTIMVQVIIEDVVACFFETQCICTEWHRKQWNTMQSVNILYVNCCSTTVSFLYTVDARDRIRRQ